MGEARPLLIFPCNGNGLEALDCVGDAYRCIGFVDDTPEKQGTERCGYPVFSREALSREPDAAVLAVPGSPASYRSRRSVIEGLDLDEKRFARVVHPSASVSPRASIGHNVLIGPGVVVSATAVIGNHVCVLPNSVIHHDAVVGEWSLVGSLVTLAGGAVVSENCYIGSGSRIKNGIDVGAGALVGLGSNVVRSVAAGATVAGNPAAPIR